MNQKRIDDIRAREQQATPGPWKRGIGEDCHIVSLESGPQLAHVYGLRDGFFIAAARQDIPDLLAEVERLRGFLEAIANAKPLIANTWQANCHALQEVARAALEEKP